MPSLKRLDSPQPPTKRKKRKQNVHVDNTNDVNHKKAKSKKSSSSTTDEKKNNAKKDSKGANSNTNSKVNLDPQAKKSTFTTNDGTKTKSLKMNAKEARAQQSTRICDGGTTLVQVNENSIDKMVGTNARIREKGGENTNGKEEVVQEDKANDEASAGGRKDVDMKIESVNVLLITEKSINETVGRDLDLCKSVENDEAKSRGLETAKGGCVMKTFADHVTHDAGNEKMNTKPAATAKESKGKENLDAADILAFLDPQYSSNTPTSMKAEEDQGGDFSTARCMSDSILEKGSPFGRPSPRQVCGVNGSDVDANKSQVDTGISCSKVEVTTAADNKKEEDKKQQSRESIVTLGKALPEPKRVSFDQMEDGKFLGKKSLLKKPHRVSTYIKAGQQSSGTSPKWTLTLRPMSKDAAAAVLHDRGISFSEPIYLCPGGTEEYNVARNIISLSVGLDNPVSKVELGRSKTTGIMWSAISRKLCDVLLDFGETCPTAFLIMKKPEQEVAVCINGHELNVGVGEKTMLKQGTILALYGPTGFSYRVEIVPS